MLKFEDPSSSILNRIGATEEAKKENAIVQISETIFTNFEKILLQFKDKKLQEEYYKHEASVKCLLIAKLT